MSVALDLGERNSSEWHRLSKLQAKHEPRLRLAYTRAVRDGRQVDKLELRQAVTSAVAETALTTANRFGLVFNPNSPCYIETIDELVDKFASIVDSPQAREEVKRILPPGLTLVERRDRLNTFGLDTKSAVRVEKMRQDKKTEAEIQRVRQDAMIVRGNNIASTEANRVVNTALETLWLDNIGGISKADDSTTFYDASTVTRISSLPKTARKEWLTRRDDRVCKFCDPLDGITARIGQDFDTEYGLFSVPPIHPHCRCFIIIGARGKK